MKLGFLKDRRFWHAVFSHFQTFYTPFLFLVTFDLFTTYLGACVFNGYEKNSFAINLGASYGFISVIGFMYLSYIIISFVYGLIYTIKKGQIAKIFIVVVWTMMIIQYVQAMELNTNSLYYFLTGKNLFGSDVATLPQEQIQKIVENFEPRRESFCRLI